VIRAPSYRRAWNPHARFPADSNPIATQDERPLWLRENRYYEALTLFVRYRANNRDIQEMAEDEEAEPNNARLFRIAISNSLKNIAESVR